MTSVPDLDHGKQWAVIILSRKTHVLVHYKQADDRREAVEEARTWREQNPAKKRECFVYVGRTRGF